MLIYREKIDCLRIIDDSKSEWLIVMTENDKIVAIPTTGEEGPYKITRKGMSDMFGIDSLIFLEDV